jgi:hypothetical protein
VAFHFRFLADGLAGCVWRLAGGVGPVGCTVGSKRRDVSLPEPFAAGAVAEAVAATSIAVEVA